MSFKIKKNYKVGEILTFKVVELSGNFIIVSDGGKLLRVQNNTGQKWRENDRVSLVVKKIQPLELNLVSSKKTGLNLWC